MIGNFVFSEFPAPDSVAVNIGFTGRGVRIGKIELAERCKQALAAARDYPSADNLTIEAAFCYGLFLALKLGADLVVTGDPSAWNPEWGQLYEASAHEKVSWLDGRFG
jgi:hypothetical protein